MSDWVLGAIVFLTCMTTFGVLEWMIKDENEDYLNAEEEFRREMESHWHGKK